MIRMNANSYVRLFPDWLREATTNDIFTSGSQYEAQENELHIRQPPPWITPLYQQVIPGSQGVNRTSKLSFAMILKYGSSIRVCD